METQIVDPCVQECFEPNSSWKYVSVAECLNRCKSLNITKPV